ncbi:MAG: hypothetical protein QNK83_11830 [Akkermansiaceae bacterium]
MSLGSPSHHTSLIALLGLSLGNLASGQVVTPTSTGNSTANWLQDWTNGSGVEGAFTMLPQAGDGTVIINQGRTIQVDSVVTTVAPVVVIQNTIEGAFPTAFLEINTGGSITMEQIFVSQNVDAGMLTIQGGTLNVGTSGLYVEENGVVNVTSGELNSEKALFLRGGDFNLSGGTVTLTDPTPGGLTFDVMGGGTTGSLNITGGDFIVAGATAPQDTILFRGEINISGGTFSAVGGQAFGNGASNTTFNIIGDEGTINIDRFNNLNANRQTAFNFVFNETGVSSVSQGGSSYISLGSTEVTIDGSAYSGGPAVFELFDYNNIVAICPDVTITGLGTEGVNYTFTQSIDDNNFTLTILTDSSASYNGWAAGFPDLTDTDPNADPDGDGLTTGVEFVLGGNPTAGVDTLLAPIATNTGSTLEFEFRRSDLANGDSDTRIEPEYSNDLFDWLTAEDGDDDVTIVVTDDFYEAGIDRVVVSLPISLATEGTLYARLRVRIAP